MFYQNKQTNKMEKTHWKKNNDTNFISGEDLYDEINGLKREQVVELIGFKDAESYDIVKQQKKIVTALLFKDIYKPVILSATNAKFFKSEFGSGFINDWVGKIVIMYAMADKRNGYVVRFKGYSKKVLIVGTKDFDNCLMAFKRSPEGINKINSRFIVSPETLIALQNG